MFTKAIRIMIVLGFMPFAFYVQATQLDWAHYKAHFLMSDGRIVDTGNHDISHTEGQGTGMLLAVAANDRVSFDRIWTWTKTTLSNADTGLFYWKYNPVAPVPVADKNNASDGDVLIAWALLQAGQHWHNEAYIQASDDIVSALIRHTIIEFSGKKVMLPGMTGFQSPHQVILNPSYFIFPAWQAFAQHTHLTVINHLIDDAHALLAEMSWGKAGLPTDWVALQANGTVVPAMKWPARMSYDAIRIPLYLIWAQPETPLLSGWRHWFGQFERLSTPAWVNVQNNQYASYGMRGGLLAVRDLTMGQLHIDRVRITDTDDYYSASLKLLSVLAAQAAPAVSMEPHSVPGLREQ